jgi:hypothetical protein
MNDVWMSVSSAVIAARVAGPGGAGFGSETGGGDVVVAEGRRDDRCGHVEDVLAAAAQRAGAGR